MVSEVARNALVAAYRTRGVSSDEALLMWTQAGYLKDEKMVRRLGNFEKEAERDLENAGCEVPLWLPMYLHAHFEELKKSPEEMRKRQRTAVASNKKDLVDVLDGLKITADMEFVPRSGLHPPGPAAFDNALNTMHRSLLSGHLNATLDFPPEQPAREFVYHVKEYLPERFFNEIRFSSEAVKRPDVFVETNDKLRYGLVELKKILSPAELQLTLAQVAVYAACWAASAGPSLAVRDMRFAIVSGVRLRRVLTVQVMIGLCIFRRDCEGEPYVQHIRYENGEDFALSSTDEGKAFYQYPSFVKILQRLYWVGGTGDGGGGADDDGGGGAVLHVSGDLGDIDEFLS